MIFETRMITVCEILRVVEIIYEWFQRKDFIIKELKMEGMILI